MALIDAFGSLVGTAAGGAGGLLKSIAGTDISKLGSLYNAADSLDPGLASSLIKDVIGRTNDTGGGSGVPDGSSTSGSSDGSDAYGTVGDDSVEYESDADVEYDSDADVGDASDADVGDDSDAVIEDDPDAEVEAVTDAARQQLKKYYADTLKPALVLAQTDDDKLNTTLPMWTSWVADTQVSAVGDEIAAEKGEARGLSASGLKNAIGRANQKVIDSGEPTSVRDAMNWLAVAAQVGFGADEHLDDATVIKSIPVTVVLDGWEDVPAEIGQGDLAIVTVRFGISINGQAPRFDVPLHLHIQRPGWMTTDSVITDANGRAEISLALGGGEADAAALVEASLQEAPIIGTSAEIRVPGKVILFTKAKTPDQFDVDLSPTIRVDYGETAEIMVWAGKGAAALSSQTINFHLESGHQGSLDDSSPVMTNYPDGRATVRFVAPDQDGAPAQAGSQTSTVNFSFIEGGREYSDSFSVTYPK